MQGDAKQEICDFCEAQSADLLIVTSTIRGRLRKALSPMGGVSSQLVLEAPCPVLVLPTQGSGVSPVAQPMHADSHRIACDLCFPRMHK